MFPALNNWITFVNIVTVQCYSTPTLHSSLSATNTAVLMLSELEMALRKKKSDAYKTY